MALYTALAFFEYDLQAEVDCVMELLERSIRDNMDVYSREGIRMHVIGDPSRRPASLQDAAREAEEMTKNNSRFHLILAICYSGRWDIVQACRELATKVQDNLLRPEDIDEALLAGQLATNVLGEFACPDLLIRTSGELRLSNFLLWQSAYTELYFTNTMWPDFGEEEYLQALKAFQSRERRFGLRKPQADQ
ncbi:Dehydrodolichyl diphosphate synthase 2 [Dichanthelium oligosanthes]|uniref:Alkyl transferase n=1 Tax=Dichanthelium oligosanthes TaxID=888268 RepID=A0A1E5VN29_9POAL|nr:Dehydrodolichyl diphosphate synthase 2 [Dichanthelium oligosanthes]